MSESSAPAPGLWSAVRTTLVLALLLAAAAALGYPGVAMLVAALAVLAAAVSVLASLVTTRWHRLRVRAVQLCAYLVVLAVSIAAARWFSQIAEPRRDRLVAAIEAYHAERGQYPDALESLVPAFLDEIPLAVPTPLADRRFRYRPYDGTFILHYSPAFATTYIYTPDAGGWRLRD